MPTDENTQAVQQNGNPIVNPGASSNVGNSDDFDFSFDSDLGTSVSNDQSQMVGQGRTGMFLTPDEEAEKEELQNSGQPVSVGQEDVVGEDPALLENNGSYFPNVNVNNNMESNDDSLGLDTDETDDSQNDKFDDKIEDMISFDDDSTSSDTDVSTSSDADDSISSNAGELPVNVNDFVSVDGDNSAETVTLDNLGGEQLDENENTVQNVDLKEQDSQDVLNSDSTNTIDGLNDTQSDDWLQQEDKKVEETFGGENVENSQNIEVNESPADVAQNVENLLNNTTSDSESNFGGIDNVGNSDTSLPDGLGQQVDPQTTEPNYVPNEADFSAMSNLLNSSSTGQVDFSNVDNQPENSVNFGGDIGALNNSLVSDPVQNDGNETNVSTSVPLETLTDTTDNTATIVENPVNSENTFESQNVNINIDNEQSNNQGNNIDNNADNNVVLDSAMMGNQSINVNPEVQDTSVSESINLGAIGDLRGSYLGNPDNNAGNPDNNAGNPDSNAGNPDSNAGNFDSNVGSIDNQGVPLDKIIDQEIQDMHVQPQNVNTQNVAGVVNNQVQPQNIQGQNNKRKKQSGIVVLLVVFALLIIAGFVLYKMFPDKFPSIFSKGVAVGYVTGNENVQQPEINNQVDENVVNKVDDLDNVGNDGSENNGEGLTENNGELTENPGGEENNKTDELGEDLDPNSLAGLLASSETGSENNVADVVENTGLVTDEIPNSGGSGTGEDFDPFAQIDNVLSEEKSDADKLNEYIVQGTYYKELGISKNDKKMERYGDYIIFTATEELTKLENGEEIDNSVFGRLDSTLETLQE